MTRENNPPPGQEFTKLLAAARGGDRDALGKLFGHCQRVLRRRIECQMSQRLRARNAPSDVIQQALLEAVRDFASFRGERYEELLDWLHRIVRNSVSDLLRHQTAGKRDSRRDVPLDDRQTADGPPQELKDEGPGPEQLAARREDEASFWSRVEGLPERTRQVVQMRFREHLRYSDIADRLGCSPDAARMICVRVLRELRRSRWET
jgi:RNA polymerase sigma-70 factor (subfamily 1)